MVFSRLGPMVNQSWGRLIRSSPPGAWFVDVGGKKLGTCVCVCVRGIFICHVCLFVATHSAAKSKNSIREAKVAERTYRGSPRLFPFGCWVNLGNFMGRSICEVVARKGWNTTRPFQNQRCSQAPKLSHDGSWSSLQQHRDMQHRDDTWLTSTGQAAIDACPDWWCTYVSRGRPSYTASGESEASIDGIYTSKSLGFELSRRYIFLRETCDKSFWNIYIYHEINSCFQLFSHMQ